MATKGAFGDPKQAATHRSYAELLSTVPQPILEVNLPVRAPTLMDGEVYVLFSKEEIQKSAAFTIFLGFEVPTTETISGCNLNFH